MSCTIPSLKYDLTAPKYFIYYCFLFTGGQWETLVYRRNSWRSAQFSLTSACLHVTLLARVGWRVDRRDADSFSIWKESCPGRGGVMEGNDIIHLEFICYSPDKKKTCAWDLIQRTTIWLSEKSYLEKTKWLCQVHMFSCSQIQAYIRRQYFL